MRSNALCRAGAAIAMLPLWASAQFNINTFAGGGPNQVLATTVPIGLTQNVVADGSGNVYFSASALNRVFKVDPSGTLTVVAGYGIASSSGDGGLATSAGLFFPRGLALDGNNNLYIADSSNNRVRRVNLTTGIIANFAGNGTAGFAGDGSAATGAALNNPVSIAIDGANNVYISDLTNYRIRKVDTSGFITTFAGVGTPGFTGDGSSAAGAQLNSATGIAYDAIGKNLFVADSNNNRVRRISLSGANIIQTVVNQAPGTAGFSGDGNSAFTAQLNNPVDVFVDVAGNLYISDQNNFRIRKVLITSGTIGNISTIAGSANGTGNPLGDGALATAASLQSPQGVTVSPNGNIYIADRLDGRIRVVTISNSFISTLAGNGGTVPTYAGDAGQAVNAILNQPYAEVVDSQGNTFIADTFNHRVRKVDANGVITLVAGTGVAGFSGDGGAATSAQLFYPTGVAIDSSGNVYIADFDNNRIRRIVGGIISTYAGNGAAAFAGDGGQAAQASLSTPYGIAIDGSNNLYIADTGNHVIRKVAAASQIITTFVGNGTMAGNTGDGGPPTAAAAKLNRPTGVAVNSAGTVIYIADQNNNKVRWVSNSILGTFAGTGVAGFAGDGVSANVAQLNAPSGVTLDTQNNLYIADFSNNRIRRVAADSPNNMITTVAGSSTRGFGGDGGPATSALLATPFSLAVDASGRVYIGDISNNRVRILSVPCTYSLSQSSMTVAAAAGGPFNVLVTAPAGCPWSISASAGVNWITITGGLNSTGSGNASFTVVANPSVSLRNAALTIAGQAFTLTQSGAAPAYAINPTSVNLPAAGGSGTVLVTAAPADAPWTAQSLSSFITITSGSSGTGNGAVGYSVAANSGGARTGTLTIAGQTFTVNQATGTGTGAGTAALTVWRPSNGTWYVNPLTGPQVAQQWGLPGDIPVTGDYDHDGILDFAVWRPSEGNWYVIPSSNPAAAFVRQWGLPGDIPVPGDYDGDGKTDFAVWRPSEGNWYIIPSGNPGSPVVKQWGLPGDIPVVADFDGDHRADFVVWRPSNGTWYITPTTNPGAPIIKQWGLPNDKPVAADYDGDGKADFAVWRPSEGNWYITPSSNPGAPFVRQWGLPGDIPVPKDYDSDGKADFAVWRPANGTWYIVPSTNSGVPLVVQWGLTNDVPAYKPTGN